MKFVRFLKNSSTRIGLVKNSLIYDVSEHIKSQSIEDLKAAQNLLCSLELSQLPSMPFEEVEQVLECVADIGKVICIGANSKTHNKQIGVELQEPMFFFKPDSAVSGALDPIPYTDLNKKIDWEGELAVIIGKSGKNIQLEEAMEHIFGYACFNDLSDRHWQFKDGGAEIGGQTCIAKCFDGFAPLGPLLVTKDEIENPYNLEMTLKVNGEVRQQFNSNDYIRGVAESVSQLSRFMTLNAGDVIALGSGPGNAKHWNEQYLQPGDKVSFHIEGLGTQQQTVVKA